MNNPKGFIAWFVHNPVAANLLLVFVLVFGVQTLFSDRLPVEVFPQSDPVSVTITASYAGTYSRTS